MIFHKPILKASIFSELDLNFQLEQILVILIDAFRNILEGVIIAFVFVFGEKHVAQLLVRGFMRVDKFKFVFGEFIRSLRVVLVMGMEQVCE